MWKELAEFCRRHGAAGPVGVEEATLSAFIAQLHLRGVSATTAKSYLAAITTMGEIEGGESAVRKMKSVRRMIEGMRRQGAEKERRQRLPITVEVLQRLEEQAERHTASTRDIAVRALMWTATCGLFRLGELVGERAARLEDLVLHRGSMSAPVTQASRELMEQFTHISIKLRRSKTDVGGKGATVWIAQPEAVTRMRDWIERRRVRGQMRPDSPLLVTDSWEAWKREEIIAEVRERLRKAGLRAEAYAGHSFRIGGATTLALRGTPAYLIQKMGRWSSDCFLRYIHDPIPAILRESGSM